MTNAWREPSASPSLRHCAAPEPEQCSAITGVADEKACDAIVLFMSFMELRSWVHGCRTGEVSTIGSARAAGYDRDAGAHAPASGLIDGGRVGLSPQRSISIECMRRSSSPMSTADARYASRRLCSARSSAFLNNGYR